MKSSGGSTTHDYPTKLNELKAKVIEKFTTDSNITEKYQNGTLVFPIHHFEGIADLKKVVTSLGNGFQVLLGERRVMLAMKKNSIVNIFVQNKQLTLPKLLTDNQKCNLRGCLQCPIVNNKRCCLLLGIEDNHVGCIFGFLLIIEAYLMINGCKIIIPIHLNSNTK